ncbi:MAG: maleylacetoacetate isomerase [Pseudomonadota bacterium]
MKLYGYWRSSASYRVRIALAYKGIDYVAEPVNLLQGAQRESDYLARNPAGLVPTLELADGTLLTQSGAIIEYLEETCPAPPLLPEAPALRARVRALASMIGSDLHPLNNLRVLNYLTDEIGASTAARERWYLHWLAQGFAALEPQLDEQGFACGGSVTLADLYLVPQVYNALRFEFDLAPYTKVSRCYEHLIGLPAFRAAAPERQQDAPASLREPQAPSAD